MMGVWKWCSCWRVYAVTSLYEFPSPRVWKTGSEGGVLLVDCEVCKEGGGGYFVDIYFIFDTRKRLTAVQDAYIKFSILAFLKSKIPKIDLAPPLSVVSLENMHHSIPTDSLLWKHICWHILYTTTVLCTPTVHVYRYILHTSSK